MFGPVPCDYNIYAYIVLTETLAFNGQEALGMYLSGVAGLPQHTYACSCCPSCWAVCPDLLLAHLPFQAQMFDPPPGIFHRISGILTFEGSKVLPGNGHFHLELGDSPT